MSTRSNILIGNEQFYHHWDGYPEGVGQDLAYFLANINAGHLKAWNGSLEKLAEYVRYNGIPGRLGTDRGVDKAYEYEPEPGLHGDIEFLYLIQGKPGHYKLYCVDVWKYLESTPFEGDFWEHPFFMMKTSELTKKFCKPEYEMTLPSPQVPEGQRLYKSFGTFTHDEAKHCGMGTDIGYGDSDYRSGFVRIRNVKRKTVVREPSICPRCGRAIRGYPAISRRDGAEICSECGTAEAWEDYAKSRRERR